ncbi:efflux RND transporter permease subunit [Mucilaginibacter sp. L3T2-6]|uniref:efflux RND transporter permease subunit n=1 Tax=Mucilaginibacter sp. L3T2-6 TaxID=3062491 RepID=UPI0026769A91|nr:efflux RND transporter permease subunit [Mucilaginibacter sp. L3T2-6]MDO3644220.1 efflux RND transporter permease subunit [Mucilaginibacter sp. L3T2-6]MDV6216683.1 efflux RND transporter permease subunit [Mucilaginibacter sp. L3T2-6]
MGMIKGALQKPITILVIVAGLFFFGINAVRNIKIDIFPDLDLPVIYVSHPYGGFTPNQMEAYFGKQYVNLLLFVSGVKSIETKNIQGLTLIKVTFYEGTNMAQAAAEVTSYTNRAQAGFPQGSQPPFILRFDASTLPVGQLVLSSPTRSNNELLDYALVYVRSSFTTVPGLIAPAPFGGNQRTIVIKADPELLRAHNLTPDQIVQALRDNNQNSPAGNVRIGDYNYLTPANTTIKKVPDFGNIPLFKNGIQTVFLRDVATVEDGADITNGYALINGKRSVYLPITKAASASTWDVVQNLKKAIPRFQALLPPDVKLSFVFDQSVYVINAVKSLAEEGAIGAVLTGLMVLLFLGDKRGALIVILTIPTCVISGIFFLYLFHQTINIMTLSGLSLAIGILVDESTVTIENIHQHFDMGKPKALAVWDACKEIAFPKLLILFCILAVFAPAFTMGGIPGALFLPLSLAIGFSMIVSYLLAQTFVPIMANWIMKNEHEDKSHADGFALEDEGEPWEQKELAIRVATKGNGHKLTRFDKFRLKYLNFIDRMMPKRRLIVAGYVITAFALAFLLFNLIGHDVLPKVNSGAFQVRLRGADGTRLERTEASTLKALKILQHLAGKQNIEITSTIVGTHPSSFSTNPIYMFMAGPQEAVMQVAMVEGYKEPLDDLKERFRHEMKRELPDIRISFEPIELTDKILSQGSTTPIEIAVTGKNKKQNVEYAGKVVKRLQQINYLRDVQIAQSYKYPAISVDIDRVRAAELGVSINDISRTLTASTSSSRFTEKNNWIDEKAGLSYLVQVQVPEYKMASLDDIRQIPVLSGQSRPALGDVAAIRQDTTYGENDNIGAVPTLSVTANIHKTDLGTATNDVNDAIKSLGKPPRGLTIELRGLTKTLTETLDSLQTGLLVAVIVIFLMLAANFQSFKMSLVVLSTVPAVLFGSLLLVKLTGATLNLQSYMGMIMSVGVSISNAVLLITNAEELRKHNGDALKSAREAAALRLRPILMTSLAMVVGMIPMASGLGEGGDQTSPLGRAVIGGLLASTFAALLVLPLVFAWVQGKASTDSVSLDPEDKESKFYVPLHHHEHVTK